jgi:GntR family transcriptional regulator/MocR family aminotransferase
MEEPAYFGASVAFGNAGARIIAVPVDEEGLSVSAGKKTLSACQGCISNAGSPVFHWVRPRMSAKTTIARI